MNQKRLLTIIKSPYVSEKSIASNHKYPKYAFKVVQDAKKPEIKKAVQDLFNVTVKSVCTINVKGKQTRFGRKQGYRSGWKKAYVTLAEGNEIDIDYGE